MTGPHRIGTLAQPSNNWSTQQNTHTSSSSSSSSLFVLHLYFYLPFSALMHAAWKILFHNSKITFFGKHLRIYLTCSNYVHCQRETLWHLWWTFVLPRPSADSGCDHPDYPSCSWFTNTICDDVTWKTQQVLQKTTLFCAYYFYKHAQLCQNDWQS